MGSVVVTLHSVSLVLRDNLEILDLKDHRGLLVQLGKLDLPDYQEKTLNTVRVQNVKKVQMATQGRNEENVIFFNFLKCIESNSNLEE
ncbi:unnamed protein product [Wuchereria bancrofti]|uniref:Uncharacterized protein n=1 Tax=Wuchereria bancrofti TaxID=6293 RepID=A0A3P7FG37_WUCBA|nr:unnamed protein product [Wuchereria bancrofti]